MAGIAVGRLAEERKSWRKDHPAGFWARPASNTDGSNNMLKWEAGIPGKEGTDWEGGEFRVVMHFSNEYPMKPPICAFSPPIYHVNVFPCGQICLSILKEGEGWKPAITIKQMLLGIQSLLNEPNTQSPAQPDASRLFMSNPVAYRKKIKDQTMRFVPSS